MDHQQAITVWMEKHGLSLEAVAVAGGVAYGTVRAWLRSESKGPPISTLRRLEASHPGLLDLLFPKPPRAPSRAARAK